MNSTFAHLDSIRTAWQARTVASAAGRLGFGYRVEGLDRAMGTTSLQPRNCFAGLEQKRPEGIGRRQEQELL
jgi:hypothetical protein